MAIKTYLDDGFDGAAIDATIWEAMVDPQTVVAVAGSQVTLQAVPGELFGAAFRWKGNPVLQGTRYAHMRLTAPGASEAVADVWRCSVWLHDGNAMPGVAYQRWGYVASINYLAAGWEVRLSRVDDIGGGNEGQTDLAWLTLAACPTQMVLRVDPQGTAGRRVSVEVLVGATWRACCATDDQYEVVALDWDVFAGMGGGVHRIDRVSLSGWYTASVGDPYPAPEVPAADYPPSHATPPVAPVPADANPPTPADPADWVAPVGSSYYPDWPDPVARPWSLSSDGYDAGAPDRILPASPVWKSAVQAVAQLLGSAHRGQADAKLPIHSYRLYVIEDANGDQQISGADGNTLATLLCEVATTEPIGWDVETVADDDAAGEGNLLPAGVNLAVQTGKAYFLLAHVVAPDFAGNLEQNWPACQINGANVVTPQTIDVAGLTLNGGGVAQVPARSVAWVRVNKREWTT